MRGIKLPLVFLLLMLLNSFAVTASLSLQNYELNFLRPPYYLWPSYGSIISLKPQYGTQVFPEKPLSEKEKNRELLFSNSPESITGEAMPALLFRARTQDSFRLLLHHQNLSGKHRQLFVYFVNPAQESVDLYISRSSNMVPMEERGWHISTETMSGDPALAGRNALVRWFMPASETRFFAAVPPQGVKEIRMPFRSGRTLTSMSDFEVRRGDGTPAAVTVVIAAGEESLNRETVFHGPLAPDRHKTPQRMRGIFDYNYLEGTFAFRLSDISYAEIGSAVTGPYACSNPGEYRESIPMDLLDLQKHAGNFGVIYRLNFRIANDGEKEETFFLIAAAAGGRSACVLKEIDGRGGDLPRRGNYGGGFVRFPPEVVISTPRIHKGWIFGEYAAPAGETVEKSFFFSLPCGCNGPIRFYVCPKNRIGEITKI